MAEGLLDIFTSHRTKFNDCNYYKKINNGMDNNYIEYEDAPSGNFYAEESRAYQENTQIVNGVMLRSYTVGIKTEDDIKDLEVNDLVEWDDEKWRVTDIQKAKIVKENQFMKEVHYEYYVSLKR